MAAVCEAKTVKPFLPCMHVYDHVDILACHGTNAWREQDTFTLNAKIQHPS